METIQPLIPIVSLSDCDDWYITVLKVQNQYIVNIPDRWYLEDTLKQFSLSESSAYFTVSPEAIKPFISALMLRDDCYDITIAEKMVWGNRDDFTADVLALQDIVNDASKTKQERNGAELQIAKLKADAINNALSALD